MVIIMTKKQKYNTEDNRGVAIYARKSRITNKGDSIGVQFKQCAEYAKRELHLDEDYTFLEYEDKGLSGYYSDRPDFQRMLHDIEMGKIRAVVCYKLDRIGRKTSDLLRLLDFLEKHKVDLLICSNNINTASGVSKIFIQIFAVVAEFERDTLTERITDNMMELAKDGRWLGGNTPTGFTVKRVKTGSGKNKSAYSYLESIPEEKAMIQKLYEIFAATRSIKKTADKMNELGYHTKIGSKFNTSTTRLLLKNPVYCTADENAYNYFLEHNGGLCGDVSEFDGQHGISAYNKTDQEKFEDADSTFIAPKFVQLMSTKPLSEWIISVGRHEGFISSQQWIDTQNMLDDIAEKYNRPHRKTNALLAGLVYCPHCGKRLRVISESNRWTNGKPRFKYVCPGFRAGECTFRAVDGVLLDEFVVKQLSHLADEDSEYFEKLLNQKASDIFSSSQNEKELSDLRKKKAQLEAAISNQVKNLREADDGLKRFIQEDVKALTDELSETETLLQKLEDNRQSQMYAIRDIEEIKERLLSFGKYAENATPDVLVTLIQTFVERIYITDENDERHCHIFIKGCSKEDYDDFFRATGYIENTQETGAVTSVLPVCDSDECCKRNITVFLYEKLRRPCKSNKTFVPKAAKQRRLLSMKARYENKAAEWVRRVVLAVLLAVLLFAPGRCIYQNRTVAEMNEYVTAFTYKGESYRSVDPPYGYVLGTQIGKTQNGYRLFRAEGDAGEQFLIAEHIGPRADPICFAKEGTQIPGEGTVSSAIIGRKATADEHILRAVQAIMEAAQDEAVAYDEAGTGRLELYLCFEGCPVSNRSAGTFLYVDQQAWYYESRPKSGALTPVTDERLLSFLEGQRISRPWSWFEDKHSAG